ncbi:MAG: hypothetical protein ABGZ35_04685, partial [Planctomycetaceae bacterium]
LHHGLAEEIIASRTSTLDLAFMAKPERFVHGVPCERCIAGRLVGSVSLGLFPWTSDGETSNGTTSEHGTGIVLASVDPETGGQWLVYFRLLPTRGCFWRLIFQLAAQAFGTGG